MNSSNQILGTGLSGLVGSRVVELNPQYQFKNLSLESGYDILKPETIEPVFANFASDVVVHFAAFTDTNAAWNQKDDKSASCYQINVIGTQNIVNLCQKYGKHLIFISTDYVFDGSKKGEYLETDTPNPIDWYGQTKYFAEQLIPSESSIIRIASPYRAQYDQKIDLVRKIIAKIKNNETCKLFSDQFTTPTFIDDIALGLTKVFENPKSGTYHLVGSSSQSIYDMGKLIAKTFNFDQKLIESSSLAAYLKTENARPYGPNLSLSNQKFIDTFGFIPQTLSAGLLSLLHELQN